MKTNTAFPSHGPTVAGASYPPYTFMGGNQVCTVNRKADVTGIYMLICCFVKLKGI